jgi:trimeric autotransporter adhesin
VIRPHLLLPVAIVVLALLSGVGSAATTEVTALSQSFAPSSVTIAVGDTVNWTGLSGGFHNVTSSNNSFPSSPNGASTHSHTFTAAGTYDYVCTNHSGMGGSVTVTGQAATATPTATPTTNACGTTVLSAALFGSNQVPSVSTSAYGSVRLTFDASAGTITGLWALNGLSSNATLAHIHTGGAGTNGGVLVDFSSQVPAAGGTFATTTTGVSASTIAGILANPAGFYVNVHTANNGSGELRGQLVCAPAVVPNAVSASLLGRNQVPAVTSSALGTVQLTLDAASGSIGGAWTINNLSSNATLAHIHAGELGSNGGVIVDFSSGVPAAAGTFTTFTTGVSASIINAVRYAPHGYYVNVHTSANGSGEVRGQLAAPRALLPAAQRAATGN